MNALTNASDLSLAMAVWLAHDDYDAASDSPWPDLPHISATTLLKPIRQTVLAQRVPPQEVEGDVADLISSKFGSAIHDSIEHAWKHGHEKAMRRLGLPAGMIRRIRINPEDGTLQPGDIPVYLEQRAYRKISVNGQEIVISGKFDQVFNGEVNDTKTTSVYTWIKGSKDEDYCLQGSIYRWLSPEKITSDVIRIQHIFTDWQGSMARTQENYPKRKLVEHVVELKSIPEIESWIRSRLIELMRNDRLPEEEVVRCTDKELWRTDPVFKYYSDTAKAASGGRATKNFPNYPAAATYRNQQGKGTVVTVPGTVKACRYCSAFPVCTQRLEYELSND